ncbi:hypothetical protein ACK8P5_26185 (plasmid) [Paenibacillus sp. EC2-1]|uniref:hypothetical protein n=1 Tax=Paenibacillus sp. EC2-1 TaxID=3388665 RepID=UPI003BEEB504
MKKQGNCFRQNVDQHDLVVAETSEFDLTEDRVYLVLYVNWSFLTILNDLGKEEQYADEHFRFYNGERVER